MPAVILVRVATLASLLARCRTHLLRGHPPKVSRLQARRLLEFGGWVTVTSIIGPLMVVLDRFAIGALLGAKAVTYYTVPFQLAEKTTILPGALSAALFPRLSAASKSDAAHLAGMAVQSLAAVLTPLTLAGLLLVSPFLSLWLSADFASRAGLTAQILVLGFWINAMARIPYAQLQAAGRPDLVAKCHLMEVVPYLLLLAAGLHYWNLPGAAVAFGLRTLGDCALLMWLSGSLKLGLRILALPAILLFVGLGVVTSFQTWSAVWWLSASLLTCGAVVWSWLSAPDEARQLVSGVTKRVLSLGGEKQS